MLFAKRIWERVRALATIGAICLLVVTATSTSFFSKAGEYAWKQVESWLPAVRDSANSAEPKMSRPKVGNDSVVYGNVQHDVGDRSVVVGPTDNRGNTIVIPAPGGSAYGAGAAYPGPGTLLMGAGAGAGPPTDSVERPAISRVTHPDITMTDTLIKNPAGHGFYFGPNVDPKLSFNNGTIETGKDALHFEGQAK